MNIDYNKIFGVEDSYQAPGKIMEVLYNKEEREKLFMDILEANDYNVDNDFFREYFEQEHAERKSKKQDFTPDSVASLMTKITGCEEGNGYYYECCAGSGNLAIHFWDNHRKKYSPFDYKPQYHFAVLEELSDRAIPFLIVNMMIRGINCIIIHADSLTRKCKNAYFICNTKNDHLQFSGISNIPHTEQFEKELRVKFISEDYVEHVEAMTLEEINNL